MKTRNIFMIALGLTFGLGSCTKDSFHVHPSRTVTTQEVYLNNFSSIDISNAFEAWIEFVDSGEYITVEANENLHDYIVVEKNGRELEVRLKRNTNIRGDATLKVYIGLDHLDHLDVSGASTAYLENTLDETELGLHVSGASHVEGDIHVDRLDAQISGASSLEFTGYAYETHADISGASYMGSYDLETDRLDIDLSGASSAALTVNDKMWVDASGASNLYYRGDPSIRRLQLSGASDIRRR